ncbi:MULTISPECIES: TonB-dependent siderophore receptor [unclassified Beijerinckia]|uniref:TonB-dependent siderophore receptor n=1 Tax=unclassified Beijerinckia TaxID=2638183 RepID=UPI0008964C88|nr:MULTISPECIES: TonB-dependent siderophore receptor [unclassified Beijerinckia]MDH7794849.1 iron complex outermembrane receptor protein [Beijerinckia sp. GAS462]SEB77668.1 iron complex outermembrane recepter protein [Beijerinckia sp. 28-YEA-48]
MTPTFRMQGILMLTTAYAALAFGIDRVSAQSTNGASSLPAVTVDAPMQRQIAPRAPRHVRQAATGRPRAGARSSQVAQTPRPIPPQPLQNPTTILRGNGPINGYVAGRSLAGTKTDTPLLETPQAISVVGRDQIRDQNAQSVVEALRYTAGVAANANPNDGRFETLRIRGFEPVIYLDGMQLPYGTGLFARPKVDPFMLERVEVLKGPSSSLYGQIAPGGLVNLVSLLPPSTPIRTVEFQANTFGRGQAAFDVGGPVGPSGEFLYRVTGLVHAGGTQVDHVDDFRGVISPSFTWKPNADTTLTVLGSFQRDDTGVEIQFLPAYGTLYPNPYGKIPINKFVGDSNFDHYGRTQYWAGYQLEHRVNDALTLRQNLRYASLDTNIKAVIGQGGLAANMYTLNRFAFRVPEKATAFTLDNQAEARFNTGPLTHTALFGLDYRHSTGSFKQYFGPAPSINIFNTVYSQPITLPPLTTFTEQVQDQLGLHAQDQIAFDRWRLTLSGRHDWVSTETRNYLSATTPKLNQSDSAFSGRVGLNYVFDFGLSPYVAYARSFQPTLAVTTTGPSRPTTGEQIEAGVKYQPVGTNVMLTAAVFDITQQNILTPNPSGIPGAPQVQTGEARSKGVELEAMASLTEGLKLIASYTYTDTKVTKSNTAAQLGKQLIITPRNQAALWADYTFQDGAARGLSLGAGVRYTGKSYGDAANTMRIPDYALVDAALRYDLANLSPTLKGATIAINAQNIFNRPYVATCQSLSACFYGAGRVVTASLRMTW